MPTPPKHFKDEIQELLDNRLDAAACAEVERHLETCDECRREFEALRWTREVAAKRFASVEAPAELREKISRVLRSGEDRGEARIVRPHFRRPKLAAALACAAIVLIGLGLVVIFTAKPDTQPEIAARDFRHYKEQKLALELKTGDGKQMETFFTTHGVWFNTRVFDLGMMNYRLIGGRVQRVDHEPRGFFVYQGPADQILVCQMYAGTVAALPAGAVERENNGIQFFIYEKEGLTMVFWQEGTVVCVLTSDIGAEQVLQLAFAKAMKI
jgi:anti-sigma factor RsiW